jgi:hypothetical protein
MPMNDKELSKSHWDWMHECFKKEEEFKKNTNKQNPKILLDYWENIEWDTYWSKFLSIKDWQGTALSLGINPDSIIRKSQNFQKVTEIFLPAVTFTQTQANEFYRRLKLVRNVAKGKGFYISNSDFDEIEINFSLFASWALAENLVDKKAIDFFKQITNQNEIKISSENDKFLLQERPHSEFLEEKKKFKTWTKCAEHHGITRQRYDHYRKFANDRDNPKPLTNHIFAGKKTKN